MPLRATVPSDFILCPPLDHPMRLATDLGYFGKPAIHGGDRSGFCGDQFVAFTVDRSPGLHQIHEAVDLTAPAGSCVYAVAAGTVIDKGRGKLVVDHQGTGEAYASQYLHVDSQHTNINDRVVKGQAIASVLEHEMGAHLHFELWHWAAARPQPSPDNDAIPVDPTRMLYHWEETMALDYSELGTIDLGVIRDLDRAQFGAVAIAAYEAAEIEPPEGASVEVLTIGAAWQVIGEDVTHLLRRERESIRVARQSRGTRTSAPAAIDGIALTQRLSYPTFLVDAGGVRGGIPLHKAGTSDWKLVDLIQSAYERALPARFDYRGSAYWSMDGSYDDVTSIITGVAI